ncbi:MAG: 3-oxoacyl-ACP reductase FabG [Rickettsiaceae bacterium]|nr:MAG: 3-oxoacyl-ACP reductase FabG [Rickettsiaceae bacterium]
MEDTRVALITGASGDIGKAITISLHQLGYHVIISGSREEKLQQLANQLKTRYTIKVCDLADSIARSSLITSIDERLDVLVCNAGITADAISIRMTDDSFAKVIDINLEAAFTLNRDAIKRMLALKNTNGRIINISSVVGVSGNRGQANYSASKAGLIGMTKSLAQEVASRGITINSVAPGFIKSDMTNKLTDSQMEYIKQKIPANALGTPEDVAHVVAFLASKEASYITGQTIHVNGGMLMV